MAWYSFRPYVPAAERRRRAEQTARKLAGKGRALAPIQLEGRRIASTFWGKAWCDNLESYSDYANRLPRGRTYVRNGSVIDLQISNGKIAALVQGYELYKIAVTIRPLEPKRWKSFKQNCAGKITNLLDLLQGRLSNDILADITAAGPGLFPTPREIALDCSCPDWADMCKHVAAVLYGVGARLDTKPELFFTLRGVDMQDLVTAASATAAASGDGAPASAAALEGANLSEIFGVDIEGAPAAPSAPASEQPFAAAKRPRRQTSVPASPKRRRKSVSAPGSARPTIPASSSAGKISSTSASTPKPPANSTTKPFRKKAPSSPTSAACAARTSAQ
jgi:uncharacterized Zn finger protein